MPASSGGSGKGRKSTHIEQVPVELAEDQAKPGEQQEAPAGDATQGLMVSNNPQGNFADDDSRTSGALETAKAQIADATGAGVPKQTAEYTHFPVREDHAAPSKRDMNEPNGSTPESVIQDTVEPLAAPLQRPMKDAKKAQDEAAPVGVEAQEGAPLDGRHLGLCDKDGNAVELDSVFEQNTEPGNTFRVNKRVFEELRMPGTELTTKRLLFPEGAVVSAPVAEQMKAAVEQAKKRNTAK